MKHYVEDNGSTVSLNANDFIGGYLAKEDLSGPTVVTITELRPEEVEGASRRKLVVKFAELEKPLILNSTNISRLSSMFGTSDCSRWVGQRITIYVDNNVEYAGRQVGGIRVATAANNGTAPAPYHNQNVIPEHNYDPEFA